MYTLENIGFAYGGAKKVFDGLHISLEKGHFYGIIGPNGCGKTTLIDLLAGHLQPDQGQILFNGRPFAQLSPQVSARNIALVPQDFRINFPYTCEEVVMMGRYPYIPRFSRPDAHDFKVVETVMRQTGLTTFANRYVNQLSGGERQRVVFARSLAQDTPVLLLDEATSNLDMQHTMELLNLAAARVSEHRLVIAVMQDVNLAAMYCDRLICMHDGAIQANGALEQVLTARTLRTVFHVEAHVAHNTYSGKLQVAFKKGENP